jgi:hypothetical protein
MFPNMFSIAPLSHMLWQMLSSFHIYRWAKGEELKIKPSILGSFDGFTSFWVIGQSNWLVAKHKLNLGGTSSN